MKFCNQIGLLLWKIYVMKKRRFLGTLFEIFIPVLLCSLLLLIRDLVDKEDIDRMYGFSVPIFSIFYQISLPRVLAKQDICYERDIVKYIGVSPDTQRVRDFLLEIEGYYELVLNSTLLTYYNWAYFSSDLNNFRDLIYFLDNYLDEGFVVNGQRIDINQALLDVGFDLSNDDDVETLIQIANFTIYNPVEIVDFTNFLRALDVRDLGSLFPQNVTSFNVSDTAANQPIIDNIREFTNATTVGEFLDFLSQTTGTNITLVDLEDTFVLTPNISLNDSVIELLDEISEDLFNLTFSDIFNVVVIPEYSGCMNITNVTVANQYYPMDNNYTFCVNETDVFDVTVEPEEFLILFIDLITLDNSTTLDLADMQLKTVVEILNNSLADEILEDALNTTIDYRFVDELYTLEAINPNMTIDELVTAIQEFETLLLIFELFQFTQFNTSDFLEVNNGTVTVRNNSNNFANNSFLNTINENRLFSEEVQNDPNLFWYLVVDAIGAEVDNDTIALIVDFLSGPKSPSCLGNGSDHTFLDIFKFFESNAAMEQYTQYRDYSKAKPAIAAGIVFEEIDDTRLSYILRFNQTEVPDTKPPYVDRYGRSPLWLMFRSLWEYYNSGFLGWQNAIDQTFLRKLNDHELVKEKIGFHLFPFAAYEEDDFWLFIKRLLPLFLVISFSYPFVIIAKTIVDEKALRLKEGYKILGGSNSAYLISFMIFYFCMFSVTAFFLTLLLVNNIYTRTNPVILFLTFDLFGLVMIALAMLVGVLFDQPRLGALMAWVVFLVLFFLYRFVEEAPQESLKNLVSLCSGPSAFGFALLQLNEYEEYQIGIDWTNIDELNPLTNYRLSNALYIMFIDFWIYAFLMVYFDRVWPSKYGVRRPWYAPFVFMEPCFKYCTRSDTDVTETIIDKKAGMHRDMNTAVIEAVDESLTGEPMLELKELTKVYTKANEGRTHIAVNKLNLKMYKNQVFCLLGHNGAGKSTTCNMLTGMIPVTDGDAILNGEYSVKHNLSQFRRRIGLCPQHDMLYPRMTVWEHLQFFGRLNGMTDKEELKALCTDLLTKIHLMEKANYQTRNLSGGQKRKLSVCIALIGRTSIVILDEPTTGMDPFARRATWELIREYKKDRCIILTTHFMDEAEILADRIGIMVHGRLMCCGSAFFLKQHYDCGYALTVSLKQNFGQSQVQELTNAVRNHIYDDSARILGQAANEIVFRISFDSNQHLPTLFRHLDQNKQALCILKYSISATTLEEVFRMINSATVFTREESVSVSRSSRSQNSAGNYNPVRLSNLNHNNGKHHAQDLSRMSVHSNESSITDGKTHGRIAMQAIKSRSIEQSTDTATDTETETERAAEDSQQSQQSAALTELSHNSSQSGYSTNNGTNQEVANAVKNNSTDNNTGGQNGEDSVRGISENRESVDEEAEDLPPAQRRASFLDGYDAIANDQTFQECYAENYVNLAERNSVPCMNKYFWNHVRLQMWKRYKNSIRDWKTFWCQCCIPSFFILMGLALLETTWWEDQPVYYFNTEDWIEEKHGILPIPYNPYSNISERPSYYQTEGFLDNVLAYDAITYHDNFLPYQTTPYQSDFSLPEWQDILAETASANATPRYVSLYMSQFLDPYLIMVGANASAFHGLPTALNLASSFIAQTISESNDAYIATASQPLPRTATQDELVQAFNSFMSGITLAIGLCFVPAAYIALLVDERVTMVKHQQLVSGMDVLSYWIGNYVFDILCNFVPALCCTLYVWFFDIQLFLGEAHFTTFWVIVMYGFSITPFTYLLSLFFRSPGTAQGLMIMVYYAFAVIAMSAAWVMDIIDDKELNRTNQDLKIFYRFFPSFCLSDSFRGIVTRDITLFWGKKLDPWAWEVTGRNLTIMAAEAVGYFCLLLSLEFLSKSPVFLGWVGKFNAIDGFRAWFEKSGDELDDDVLEEQSRLQSNRAVENNNRNVAAVAADTGSPLAINSPGSTQTLMTTNGNSEEEKYDSNTNNRHQNDDESAKLNINNPNTNHPIELHGLRKVFPGSYSRPPTVAVQNLWYSVKKGEVFGFLGLNGAGKSTTLSMMSGVFPPTSGNAFINGFPISDQIAVRQSLGFCPQFSALFPRLTVYEHLLFYARVKGIPVAKVNILANQLMKDLALEVYRNRQAGRLSGGNQRKLSVGIALIGNPPIVLLDEPTSGMDPVSKRSLWDFISSTMSGRSVILTTHSMEECEALCHRIGIMINGQLGCLGTNIHLKNKFGNGYQLDIKFDMNEIAHKLPNLDEDKDNEEKQDMELVQVTHVDECFDKLKEIFGKEHVVLIEDYVNVARFQVGNGSESIADVFEHMETIINELNIVNYAVSQTSLEQIFVRFAAEQNAVQQQMMDSNNESNQWKDNRKVWQKSIACCLSSLVVD